MDGFAPRYTITSEIAGALLRIEAAKTAVGFLPITPGGMATLRKTARLVSTHYSTAIEGNRLTQEQVAEVVGKRPHAPGRERDAKEVLGYYAGMEAMEAFAAEGKAITEEQIKVLHGVVMGGGARKVRATSYRDGQNVIRDSRSKEIVYMPPEAKDVPGLMRGLVRWLEKAAVEGVPCVIRAGIAHYQFATIHPYYDGNGRTARLLTTLILHLGGYDLKGLYSLEEYYARNLNAYYKALTVGPSHNYYAGRAESDITTWVDYFCAGAAASFESVHKRAQEASGGADVSNELRRLDPRQRRAIELFRKNERVTSRDVEALFGVSQRMARNLLRDWVESGFVVMADAAKKSRKYRLGEEFEGLLG